MFQILIFFGLVSDLLLKLIDALMKCRDVSAEVRAILPRLVESCFKMTVLLDLIGKVAFSLPKPLSVLFHRDLLLSHVALHPDDLLLHPAVVLVDLLHAMPLDPQLIKFLSQLVILLLKALAFLHRLV